MAKKRKGRIRPGDRKRRIEAREPEKAAEFMILAAHPDISITRAAECCGIPRPTAYKYFKRMQTEYLPALETLRKYQTSEFLALLDDRIGKALKYLGDDEKWEKAEIRDLGVVMGILMDKRQLLQGEPTSIISVELRRRLIDSIPLIVEEARRRGEEIEYNPGEFSYTDGSSPPTARLRPDKPDTGEPIQEVRQRGGKILRRGRNAEDP